MTNKKIAYLYLIITFCAWGSLYVVSKFVLGKVPTFTVSFLRYLVSGCVLLLVLRTKKLKKIEKQDYKYIFLIGFVGYFLSMTIQFIGTKLSNASLSSLVNFLNPITIMIFAAVILKEKLTLKKVFCIVLAIIGVYIIIGGVSGNGQVIWGILMSVISVITWSFVSVMIKRITQKYDVLQITTYGIVIAAICTFPCSGYELATTANVQFDWKVILALIYMGLVCTAIAHVLWNKSLSIIEAGTCSLFYPLQPMVSVLLGVIFLGEAITMKFILGAVLIIGGVVFSLVGNKSNNEDKVNCEDKKEA